MADWKISAFCRKDQNTAIISCKSHDLLETLKINIASQLVLPVPIQLFDKKGVVLRRDNMSLEANGIQDGDELDVFYDFEKSSWTAVRKDIDNEWDRSIVPALVEFIKVPSQSPAFDPECRTNGLILNTMHIMLNWMKKLGFENAKPEILQDPGLTPILLIEIEATNAESKGTVLMYGHADKQPPLDNWTKGGPYAPLYEDGKLYGRGGADDGYALFASVASVRALEKQGIPHSRIVILVEGSEESSSCDLWPYLEKYKERLGEVQLIVCLDSGAVTYDKLWVSASLRGHIKSTLTIETASDDQHSGESGGIIPDGYRIARLLLDRIEDPKTGDVKITECSSEIPPALRKNMEPVRELNILDGYPFLPGVSCEGNTTDSLELCVRNTWKSSLTVIGDSLPQPPAAGNVIHAQTVLKLSVRTGPTADPEKAGNALKEVLEKDPPYGAKVTFKVTGCAPGWYTPDPAPWLDKAFAEGSQEYFGTGFGMFGLGGSIPLMSRLKQIFPAAQFAVTGVLGPMSNAHGRNEFLHVPFAKGITYVTARVVAAHAAA